MTKFDWKATESAPKNYPMEVVAGTFLYHGEDSLGLYVPAGKLLYRGWGQMVSSHIVGEDLKPLPDRLEITFFSYLEDQHYQGTFDLPYEKILTLFRDGWNGGERPTYDRIMVGVAPGGIVAVWLTGRARTDEIFFGKAEPVEMPLIGMRGRIVDNRDAYVQGALKHALEPAVLEFIRQNGIPFDKWSQLRTRYKWKPVFGRGNAPHDGAMTDFFNGELEELFFPMSDETASLGRAVPKKMQFTYRSSEGWAYLYIIHFDEEETTAAFQQLGSDGRLLTLEFYPEKPIHNTRIRLSNGDESINLTKYHIEDI